MTVPHTRTSNAFVGSPIERIEDFRFLTGRGQYVDDLTLDGVLHAVILRSTVAHGRIRSIDTKAARARPGVHAVITAADIGDVPNIPLRQEPLPRSSATSSRSSPTTRCAMSASRSRSWSRTAPRLPRTRWKRSWSTSRRCRRWPDRDASRKDDVLLFEEIGTNIANTMTAVRGDAEAAFKNAPYTRREHFKVQRHAAVPMEPRGLLAEWDATQQQMTVCGAAKVPFPNRRMLAKMMDLPEKRHQHGGVDVGGGFGARGEFYPEDFLVPFAARLTGRPVKWIEDRREHLLATNHARDAECELEIACTRDGTILGLRGHGAVDLGAYLRTNGATAARNIAQVMSGPYRIPHIHIDVRAADDQQDAGPAPTAGRGVSKPISSASACSTWRRRPRHRPRRIPPAQSGAGIGHALCAGQGPGARRRDRVRQRRLPHDARSLPRGIRLAGESEACRAS